MSTELQTIGEEVKAAIVGALGDIAAKLANSVYSPRIKLLGIDQVCEITGFSGRTVDRMVAGGKFPRPMDGLGERRWRESTIIAWMDAHDPDAGKDWHEAEGS